MSETREAVPNTPSTSESPETPTSGNALNAAAGDVSEASSQVREWAARRAHMNLWREHGGDQHGPNVETVTMPLANFHGFCAALLAASKVRENSRGEAANGGDCGRLETAIYDALGEGYEEDFERIADATRISNAWALAAENTRLLSEQADVYNAIGPTVRFMDPPDGGSPSLGDQVRNMRNLLIQAESELAALRSAPAEQDGGWLPVESAPKEMQPILLALDRGKYSDISRAPVIGYYRNRQGWTTWDDHRVLTATPTHWRPLPPAPSRFLASGSDGEQQA